MGCKISIIATCFYKDQDGRTEEEDGIQDYMAIKRVWNVTLPNDNFLALYDFMDNYSNPHYMDLDLRAATELELLAQETAPDYIDYNKVILVCEHIIVQECEKIK